MGMGAYVLSGVGQGAAAGMGDVYNIMRNRQRRADYLADIYARATVFGGGGGGTGANQTPSDNSVPQDNQGAALLPTNYNGAPSPGLLPNKGTSSQTPMYLPTTGGQHIESEADMPNGVMKVGTPAQDAQDYKDVLADPEMFKAKVNLYKNILAHQKSQVKLQSATNDFRSSEKLATGLDELVNYISGDIKAKKAAGDDTSALELKLQDYQQNLASAQKGLEKSRNNLLGLGKDNTEWLPLLQQYVRPDISPSDRDAILFDLGRKRQGLTTRNNPGGGTPMPGYGQPRRRSYIPDNNEQSLAGPQNLIGL